MEELKTLTEFLNSEAVTWYKKQTEREYYLTYKGQQCYGVFQYTTPQFRTFVIRGLKRDIDIGAGIDMNVEFHFSRGHIISFMDGSTKEVDLTDYEKHKVSTKQTKTANSRQNTMWSVVVRNCDHDWKPLSFVFEDQLLDEKGRVHIRQPDITDGRVYCVCMKCYGHTYVKTGWVGSYLGDPETLEAQFLPNDEQ